MEKEMGLDESRELVRACNKANHFKCGDCKYHPTCEVSKRYFDLLEKKRIVKTKKRKVI